MHISIIFSSQHSLSFITPEDQAHGQCYRSKGCSSLVSSLLDNVCFNVEFRYLVISNCICHKVPICVSFITIILELKIKCFKKDT